MIDKMADPGVIELRVKDIEDIDRVRGILHWAISVFIILYPKNFPLTENRRTRAYFNLRHNFKQLLEEDVNTILDRVSIFREPLAKIARKYLINNQVPEERVAVIMREYWTENGFDSDNLGKGDVLES